MDDSPRIWYGARSMEGRQRVARVRVGHSRAGKVALGSVTFAWLIVPVLAFLLNRFNAESANGLPHSVSNSVVMAVGGSVSILMQTGLSFGLVGLLQGKRKRGTAVAAIAMFLAWIGLLWFLSNGFAH